MQSKTRRSGCSESHAEKRKTGIKRQMPEMRNRNVQNRRIIEFLIKNFYPLFIHDSWKKRGLVVFLIRTVLEGFSDVYSSYICISGQICDRPCDFYHPVVSTGRE